jgi:hypothetical protein
VALGELLGASGDTVKDLLSPELVEDSEMVGVSVSEAVAQALALGLALAQREAVGLPTRPPKQPRKP